MLPIASDCSSDCFLHQVGFAKRLRENLVYATTRKLLGLETLLNLQLDIDQRHVVASFDKLDIREAQSNRALRFFSSLNRCMALGVGCYLIVTPLGPGESRWSYELPQTCLLDDSHSAAEAEASDVSAFLGNASAEAAAGTEEVVESAAEYRLNIAVLFAFISALYALDDIVITLAECVRKFQVGRASLSRVIRYLEDADFDTYTADTARQAEERRRLRAELGAKGVASKSGHALVSTSLAAARARVGSPAEEPPRAPNMARPAEAPPRAPPLKSVQVDEGTPGSAAPTPTAPAPATPREAGTPREPSSTLAEQTKRGSRRSLTRSSTAMGSFKYESAVCLENVSFGFPGKVVLHNISLSIPQGVKTVVMGRSGHGKSTFLKMLARLYQPKEDGSVHLFGTPANEVYLPDLMSFMEQEPIIFAGSLFDNLAMSNPAKATACAPDNDHTPEQKDAATAARNAYRDELLGRPEVNVLLGDVLNTTQDESTTHNVVDRFMNTNVGSRGKVLLIASDCH